VRKLETTGPPRCRGGFSPGCRCVGPTGERRISTTRRRKLACARGRGAVSSGNARGVEGERVMRPEKSRWTLLRAGLQNIWEYDSQVFVCHKGRLLLRGRNESGKTKALEVLFPFLLDGEFSLHRIDPFGSSARQMRF